MTAIESQGEEWGLVSTEAAIKLTPSTKEMDMTLF